MSKNSNEGTIEFSLNFHKDEQKEVYQDIGDKTFKLVVTENTVDELNDIGIELSCNDKTRIFWRCDTRIEISTRNKESKEESANQITDKVFSEREDELLKRMSVDGCDENALLIVKISVLNSTGIGKMALKTSDQPVENLTNVVLVIEDRKMYVSKEILSIKSTFFHNFFTSDSQETQLEEIVIENVKHEEMIVIMNFMYGTGSAITVSNVESFLMLTDFFGIDEGVAKAETFLIEDRKATKKISTIQALKFAESYMLLTLQRNIFGDLNSIQKIAHLSLEEGYKELGNSTISLLHQKMVELVLAGMNDWTEKGEEKGEEEEESGGEEDDNK